MESPNDPADLSALKIDRSEPPSSRRFARRVWVGIVLLALVGVGVRVGMNAVTGWKAPAVSTGRIAVVTPAQAATVLTAAGYIVARSKAEISPKSVGRVVWLNLEEGQPVKKGQVVARLESQELEAQKRQHVALFQNARREHERAKALWEKELISRQEYERAEAQAQALSAQVAYDEAQIENTEIRAPIDGVVTVKKAFLGEVVSPQGSGGASAGATFAVIVDPASLEMEADIGEANLARVHKGQSAEVTLDAYPGRVYQARLRQIVPTADRQKGSVKVKIELLEKDEKILPEMSCRVSFMGEPPAAEEVGPRLMVPVSAVVTVNGARGVLRVREDEATFTPLTFGEQRGNDIQVIGGAQGGEEIVVDAAKGGTKWESRQKIRRGSSS